MSEKETATNKESTVSKIINSLIKRVRDPEYYTDRRSLRAYHKAQMVALRRRQKASKLQRRAFEKQEQALKAEKETEKAGEPGSAGDMQAFLDKFERK